MAAPVGTEAERRTRRTERTPRPSLVTALALWLGAFGTFLLLPGLSCRLLDRALPMWKVVLRLYPGAADRGGADRRGARRAHRDRDLLPVSPVSVGVVAFAEAVMFAALYQALLTALMTGSAGSPRSC